MVSTGGRRGKVGRPSVVVERRRQILDAVEECVVRYGLEGSTLERIAAEAGVTKSNLAHFVGNRGEIIEAALTLSVNRYVEGMQAQLSDLPAEEQLGAYVELALEGSDQTRRATVVLDALSAAAVHDEQARALLRSGLERADSWIGELVRARYPDADPERRAAAAVVLPMILREFDRDRLLGPPFRTHEFKTRVAGAIEALLAGVESAPSDGPDS
jgi:AcrR family transcriptional regulator